MNSFSVAPLADHLWQSTVFALLMWLCALVLRADAARVRYRLWLAASLKFLVPLAIFASAGARIGRYVWPPRPGVAWIDAVQDAVAPASAPAAVVRAAAGSAQSSGLLIFVGALWACGVAVVLLAWLRNWIPIQRTLRRGVVRDDVELGTGVGVAVVVARDAIEPAVVGIVRPVLLLPSAVLDGLGAAELAAVVAHELCHVRRRDNLAAAGHMLVEALFWFHPLVWVIEHRLVEERERACDEEVVRGGADPSSYATAILQVCRVCVESRLACVAGIGGSHLRGRIEAIMTGASSAPARRGWRVGVAIAGALAVAVPVVTGAASSARAVAQSLPAARLSFEAASIRPNRTAAQDRGAGFQPGGRFLARNMSLRGLVGIAYGEPAPLRNFRILDGPAWTDTDGFDIEAKTVGEFPDTGAGPGFSTSGELMLRTLLADRFKLVVREETRQMPVFALVAVKSGDLGPQLKPSSGEDCAAPIARGAAPVPSTPPLPPCGAARMSGAGHFLIYSATMDQMAKALEIVARQTVVNRTGMSGRYSADLQFTPLSVAASTTGAGSPGAAPDNASGSLFSSIQDQLGLRLQSDRGPVGVVVIERAEKPSEN
jgi:uncharacterized protein (TIGR03435 family)